MFPENSLSFLCSEKSLSIPDFPGLWPPCVTGLTETCRRQAKHARTEENVTELVLNQENQLQIHYSTHEIAQFAVIQIIRSLRCWYGVYTDAC